MWRCVVLKDPEKRGLSTFSGGLGEGETPLPIPNREVKPLSADGTWLARAWESRTPPVYLRTRAAQRAARGVVGSLQNQAHPVLRGRRGPRPARMLRARSLRREGTARHSGASSPTDRTQTHLLMRRHDPRTPRVQSAAQRLPVRVLHRLSLAVEALCTGRPRSDVLVLVDLPVDAVVVLEQQERADQTQRANEALRGQLCVRR